MVTKFWKYVYSFWQNSRTCQTHRRTDRQTPHDDMLRLHSIARQKWRLRPREGSSGGVDLLPYTVLPLPRVATRRLIEFHCARVGDIGLLRCLRRGRVGRHNAIVGELCDCFESGNINRRRCRAPSVLTCWLSFRSHIRRRWLWPVMWCSGDSLWCWVFQVGTRSSA